MFQKNGLFKCGGHASLCVSALATDIDFGKISAGSPFFDPHLTATFGLSAMYKFVPVNIADVSIPARPHKSHRNDTAFLLAVVDEFAFGQHPAMDQHTCADGASFGITVDILCDKPLRKLPASGSLPSRDGSALATTRRSQLQLFNVWYRRGESCCEKTTYPKPGSLFSTPG
ncbi:hypothetical protein [Rubinisphaera italica]|uniref:hypothetical protein n=1 Tax=Rubinisphaera italica TaxID=2527969 RepID=UPI0011B71438|nr:hypothetical protein [Rubinisphaera italica]